ncbi:unnamed protein product [Orchesella dallaii]|uniref:YqaJ viral recombinase domain-containing protein n=1 Tax=Orchesella dallaii TaxID=48710 RepID=A0ABP1Q5W4_9HEXA
MLHPQQNYIGATLDALIGETGCLEIKCPVDPIDKVALRKLKILVNRTSKETGGNFIKGGKEDSGLYKLSRSHPYYTQVVMQIMSTNRGYCDFVMYYQNDDNPDEFELWQECITREEAAEFWTELNPKLTSFYHKYLGPPSFEADQLQRKSRRTTSTATSGSLTPEDTTEPVAGPSKLTRRKTTAKKSQLKEDTSSEEQSDSSWMNVDIDENEDSDKEDPDVDDDMMITTKVTTKTEIMRIRRVVIRNLSMMMNLAITNYLLKNTRIMTRNRKPRMTVM